MQTCFLIAVIITIASIIAVFKYKENAKTKIVIMIISSIVSLSILVFPLIEQEKVVFIV